MTLFRFTDPVQSLLDLQRELDQLLRHPSDYDLGYGSASGVYPPINAFEDNGGLVFRAEVPGVKPEAINVNIERQTLTISGERTRESEGKGSFHRRERRFGKFARSFRLPNDLDTEKATAQCRDGVLTIRIPKKAEAKPKQVAVLAA
jgi:HSP20 family protein